MISGIKKALKTSTIVDMAVSLGTGGLFLNHHRVRVEKAVPVRLACGPIGGRLCRIKSAMQSLANSAEYYGVIYNHG